MTARLATLALVGLWAASACAVGPEDDGGFNSFSTTLPTTFTNTNSGDADADTETGDAGDGDGDGDSGDGDGDGDGDAGDGDGDSGDGDGDSGDGDGDPNCPWVPNPEQNPAAACDPILQDCPNGEKCVAYISGGGSWDNNKCVPVIGAQAPGQPCTVDDSVSSIDNCNAQSQCFNFQDATNGTCVAFCGCTYEAPECAPGSACLVSNAGSIALCIASCDPLLQNCPPGEGCFPSGDQLICAATTSDLPVGEPCGFINDCAAGTACYNVGACGANCCTPFCDPMGGGAECAALPGTTCQAVETWGACL